MNVRVSPAVWFPISLFLIALLGATVLGQPASSVQTERELKFYGALRWAQSVFDTMSAAAGCGLLTLSLIHI